MKINKRMVSLFLSVLMIFGALSLTSYANDNVFGYYFADDSQTTVHISSFSGTVGTDGYVEIPETIDGYTVTGIAENAFTSVNGLKGIIITKSLEIDSKAFNGEVDIKFKKVEDTDDKIDTEDWYEDHKHDFIISGSTLVSYKGNDEIIAIPYNCSTIADGAFKNNDKIKTVYIEKELKKIGESAFEGCDSLVNVVAGNGVYSLDIGKNAFKGTPWLENYPSDLVTIGTTLVKYKGASTYVAIPNVFTAIAEEAFHAPENNGSIAYKVKVPITIKDFGDDCFYLYDSISKVYPQIVVFKDSAAESYCKENGLEFTYAPLPGDADRDGVTTAADARYVLRISAKLETPIIDDEVKEVADISGDSQIAADDARLILRLAAQLDEYSTDELLSMPRTDYELLFAATSALSIVRAYGASYSKLSYQEITAKDMNINTRTYFNPYENKLTSANKAQTITYAADSQEAYDNLFEISLLDASKIKDYSCEINENMYIFRLVLEDEQVNGADVDAPSFTRQMLPAKAASDFASFVGGKNWRNFNYNTTYRDCTLEMHVEITTNKIMTMFVTTNCDIEMSGKLGGIKVSGSNGPATATQTDYIRYTNFNYFP